MVGRPRRRVAGCACRGSDKCLHGLGAPNELLRCAILEDSPNYLLCLAFCVPCVLPRSGARFIPFGDLSSDSFWIKTDRLLID